MKRLVMAFAVASLGLVSSASGATLVFNNLTLTGVQGVDVGGTLYDVTFREGICADIFSGCDNPATDFAFTDPIVALGAGSDLLIEFNTLPPNTIFGCSDPVICRLVIPYGLGTSFGNPVVFAAFATNNASSYFDSVDVFTGGPSGGQPLGVALLGDTSGSGIGDELVWADFSPVASVPEPATLTLMTAALAGLGARRRLLPAHLADDGGRIDAEPRVQDGQEDSV